jgi:hypothetical protein
VEHFLTPVPEGIFQELAYRRPTYEDTSRVWRLQGLGNRWEAVRRTLIRLSTYDQVRLVFQILFPAASYMRMRYRIKSGWPVWPYFLFRWFDQARDLTWATWKRLMGQKKI